MRELRLMEKIFSITNQSGSKVIYILGIPFKFSCKLLFNCYYKYLPIDKKKIVFSNFNGNSYGCNPKYIAEEIIKQKLPYKIVWLVKNIEREKESFNFPKNIKLVSSESPKAIKELATSKIWISNVRLIKYLKRGLVKKNNQIYIQTWHGSLGIKKIDADANQKFWECSTWDGYEKQDSEFIDYLVSNSEFEDKVYQSAISKKGFIKRLGHPRNDIFYKDFKSIKEKVFKILNLPADTKIVLYVPSYRDDHKLYCYGLEYKNLLKTVTEKFGGNWVILSRMHPNLMKFEHLLVPQKDKIIDVSTYPDIQELLVASDIAITDYSSCIFDFMLSRKPAFIYATDIEDYDNDRGFYYPLKSTPFPVGENNEELIKNIKDFNYESYKQKVEEFLKSKGCFEDGKASERVVELIKSLMEK